MRGVQREVDTETIQDVPDCMRPGPSCTAECEANCATFAMLREIARMSSQENPRRLPWFETRNVISVPVAQPCGVCGADAQFFDQDYQVALCSETCAMQCWIDPARTATVMRKILNSDALDA